MDQKRLNSIKNGQNLANLIENEQIKKIRNDLIFNKNRSILIEYRIIASNIPNCLKSQTMINLIIIYTLQPLSFTSNLSNVYYF